MIREQEIPDGDLHPVVPPHAVKVVVGGELEGSARGLLLGIHTVFGGLELAVLVRADALRDVGKRPAAVLLHGSVVHALEDVSGPDVRGDERQGVPRDDLPELAHPENRRLIAGAPRGRSEGENRQERDGGGDGRGGRPTAPPPPPPHGTPPGRKVPRLSSRTGGEPFPSSIKTIPSTSSS